MYSIHDIAEYIVALIPNFARTYVMTEVQAYHDAPAIVTSTT